MKNIHLMPTDKPKPHLFCETPEEKCTMNYCDENGCQNRVRHLVEPIQETLEEATERLIIDPTLEDKLLFQAGAKWQQEQDKKMYSEQQLKAYGEFCVAKFNRFDKVTLHDEYFTEFKKK